ncbi:MAG: ATP-binding protein [Deltaproteobacteria bacterium]
MSTDPKELEAEEASLRSVALQNAGSILAARQRAEQELLRAKAAIEQKTEELAQSVALLHATLEATTDAVLVLAADGSVLHCNDNFVRMWQLPEASRPGHSSVLEEMSLQASQPEQARAQFERTRASALEPSFDVLALADGRIFECASKPELIPRSGGARVWTFRDITEARRAQERLRDEARVLEILNATGAALASKLDLPSLLQAVTEAGTQLSGAEFGAFFYNQTDEQGDSYLLFTLCGVPREEFERLGQPRATPLFEPTFRGGPPIRCDDVLTDPRYAQMGPGMPAGHLPVRSYLGVSVVSRGGEVIGGLFFGHSEPGVFSERTERLLAGVASQAAVAVDNARLYEASQRASAERQRLLESERSARAAAERMSELKDEFLANLSHELRTPLSAILGWAQMLRIGNKGEAEIHKGLITIERNARVQTQLIEDLLDMSRILSGQLRLDVVAVSPHSFIEAAVDTVRPAATAKGIRIVMLLDSAAGPILGDPNRLQQVMWNLLSNAIKFTPKDGKLQVVLERVNSQIEISVSDTGAGIDAEFLPHVFDRFRQADASSTRRHGGLGLGLSIVKHLVELHGGSVRAESPGKDCGATFSVHLPVAAVHRARGGEPRQHPSAAHIAVPEFRKADLSGVTILVVDDEADARDLIRHILSECSARVVTAQGPAEGLQLLAQQPPDVLVSDIGMPEIDGFEFLRRVRAFEGKQGRRIPAIALTAFARSEDRTRALRAGFMLHLAKPVEPSELVATVLSALGRTATD